MKKNIKQNIEYFILWHFLDSVQNTCFGALSSDDNLKRLFNELYDYCDKLLSSSFTGDIVEQYLVTVLDI